MCKSTLSNQVFSAILLSNDTCDSTGLYRCRRAAVPKIYLQNVDILYIIKNDYIIAQLDEFIITRSLWTPNALRAIVRVLSNPINPVIYMNMVNIAEDHKLKIAKNLSIYSTTVGV